MSKSHWVLIAFVATMVCNGKCRPREVEVKNIYPVYRSEKQLELEITNRYEKPLNEKSDKDSVIYHRIDIPYKNVKDINKTRELPIKNKNKLVTDYVPVALTIKKPNIKKWPSDQNGIESPDDLSLYNIYTNNINPLNPHHVTTPGYNLDFPYTTHSKPSILILEELTTRKPFYNYNNVFTQPIQVLERPLSALGAPTRPSGSPDYPAAYWSIYKPTENSSFTIVALPPYPEHNQHFSIPPTEYPYAGYEPTTQSPISVPSVDVKPHPELVSTSYDVSTTLRPETTTKKRKNTRCPNISITATTFINNNNSMNKEGCQDINIQISTDVTNSNTGLIRPNKTSNSSVVLVQNDQTVQTGTSGIFDVILSIFSRIFSFSFLNPIFSGSFSSFSAFLTGLSAFVLPWLFPHLLFENSRWNRLLVLGNESFRPAKYSKHSLGEKRSKSNSAKLQPQYMGWRAKKKISSSASVSVEPDVKAENENAIKSQPKLNIESIATVARASSDMAPLPSPAAIGHVLDTVSQLVESDIRTPPKLKEIIKEKANEQKKEVLSENSTPLPYTFIYDDEVGKFEEKLEMTDKTLPMDSSEGKASNRNSQTTTDEGVKGIAIPVVMDDDYELTSPPKKLQKIPEVPKPMNEEKKKTAITKSHSTTTPSSGLSTWILLSDNKDITTPSPKKNNKKEEDKKKAGVATTMKKPTKIQATTLKSTTQNSKKVTSKPVNKKPETEVGISSAGISALEALVKNQKKGSTTTSKPKISDPKKKLPDKPDFAETKDRVDIELPESKTTYTLPPDLQITSENKAVTTTSGHTSAQTTTEPLTEGTTKKKSTTKKKKKNKNRRKKPAEDTKIEAKVPSQPVGSQIYNFLSREIVPTVGLGLIGVALTAGLASFLGYNPFGSSTIPLRRTYDTHHGYSPNNYYNYNTDYGDGGQSEEVLFKEVLSGMPEDSRYGLTYTDTSYPDAYSRQDQIYDSMKNPVYPSATGTIYSSDKDKGNYDATYPQDYSTGYGATYDTQDKKYLTEVKEKYPVYTRETGTSFVYPETTGMTSADKTSRISDDYATQTTGDKYLQKNPDTIERQPEALYRVASESDLQYRSGESTFQGVNSQNSWRRMGSPMETEKSYPSLKPGPRSLDLSKESTKKVTKKRSKRAAESVIQRISRKRTKKENDVENEIDFDDAFDDSKFSEQNFSNEFSTPTSSTKITEIYTDTTTASDASTTTSVVSTTEDVKEASSPEPAYTYDSDSDSTASPPSGISVLDVLKRLAQFKLRLGLNFLRSTTDLFSRYLDDIQRRVDESFANTTTTTVQYNKRKNPWSRIFFSRFNEDGEESYRRKRSLLEDNQFLGAMLTAEDSINDRFSKSTKKDLRLSNKIFHQKKNPPKKYESKRTN